MACQNSAAPLYQAMTRIYTGLCELLRACVSSKSYILKYTCTYQLEESHQFVEKVTVIWTLWHCHTHSARTQAKSNHAWSNKHSHLRKIVVSHHFPWDLVIVSEVFICCFLLSTSEIFFLAQWQWPRLRTSILPITYIIVASTLWLLGELLAKGEPTISDQP